MHEPFRRCFSAGGPILVVGFLAKQGDPRLEGGGGVIRVRSNLAEHLSTWFDWDC